MELYEKCYTFADFFPNWDFSLGFLYIINFAGRISEGGAQRPVGRVKDPKKTGARARTRGKNPLVDK
jgi:hypothetical protein